MVSILTYCAGWQGVKWGGVSDHAGGCLYATGSSGNTTHKLYFVHYCEIYTQHLPWQNLPKQDIFVSFYIPYSLLCKNYFVSVPWFSRQRVYSAVSRKRPVFQETSEKHGLHHLWEWRFSSGASDALHASQNRVPFFLLLFWLCAWAFSSGSKQELRSGCGPRAFHRSGSSCCGARVLEYAGFSICGAQAPWFWLAGSRARAP